MRAPLLLALPARAWTRATTRSSAIGIDPVVIAFTDEHVNLLSIPFEVRFELARDIAAVSLLTIGPWVSLATSACESGFTE